MDPSSPTPSTPTAVPASAPPAGPPANPTYENHPSYDMMICAAIATLGKGKGCTKNAIGKFIEQNYQGLPSDHDSVLIYNLNVLASNGRLVMVNNSFRLRNSDASSSTSPRQPVRSRKRKLDQSPPDVPPKAGPSKGRGRPRKKPKEDDTTAVPVPFVSYAPPLDSPDVVPPSGASPQAVGAGSSGRIRTRQDSARRSAGRPKKEQGTSVEEELRRKLEHFQSKINQYIREIKSQFTIESPIGVIAAIQGLERLAKMDLDGPLANETQ